MAKKKTDQERIDALQLEILTLEERRAADLEKIQEKKRKIEELESAMVMKEVKAFDLTPQQLKALLAQHVKPTHEEVEQTYPVTD